MKITYTNNIKRIFLCGALTAGAFAFNHAYTFNTSQEVIEYLMKHEPFLAQIFDGFEQTINSITDAAGKFCDRNNKEPLGVHIRRFEDINNNIKMYLEKMETLVADGQLDAHRTEILAIIIALVSEGRKEMTDKILAILNQFMKQTGKPNVIAVKQAFDPLVNHFKRVETARNIEKKLSELYDRLLAINHRELAAHVAQLKTLASKTLDDFRTAPASSSMLFVLQDRIRNR